MKTVRFSQVVEAAGSPVVYLTWMKPESDPSLHAALKADRVMTVHQTVRGSGADYGTVGLHLGGHSQILIFPRSLKRFGDRRIVGIKYELFAEVSARSPETNKTSIRKDQVKVARIRSADIPVDTKDDPPTVKSVELSRQEKAEKTKNNAPEERVLSWRTVEVRIGAVSDALKRRRYAQARAELNRLAREIHARNSDEKS